MCPYQLELVTHHVVKILVCILDDGYHRISSSAFAKLKREVDVKVANHGFALEAERLYPVGVHVNAERNARMQSCWKRA